MFSRIGGKTIAIGVMSQGKLRERVLAIARGDYKPTASDPKIWFTSMKAAADVLSDENLTLLRTIAETQPASIAALAAEAGANVRRVSRKLKTLSHYGLVDLRYRTGQLGRLASIQASNREEANHESFQVSKHLLAGSAFCGICVCAL